MRTSVRRALAVVLALAGAGCTTETAAVETGLEGSVGVLHVERVADDLAAGAPAGVELDRAEWGAAFARYRGLDAGSVVGLLNSGLSGSRSPAEFDACTFVGADDALSGADSLGSGRDLGSSRDWASGAYDEVELLDVGAIRVRVAGTEASLAPRAFPDLGSVVAGVFYAGDAQLAIARADLDEYAFHADGSAEVPAFEAVVPAPAAPADLRLDAVLADADQALVASRDAGLDLSWAPADARDLVEIEIRSGGDVLACSSHDDGAFRIEPDSLATLAADAAASVVVRRVRVTSVEVPGLDDAFARVAITRSIAVDLR